MQRLILYIFFFILSPKLFAQYGFNQTYDYGYFSNRFNKVIIHNDTLVGCGIAWSGADPNQQCLFIARLDTNGIELDHTMICDSLGGHLTMGDNWAELNYEKDGSYLITASSYDRYDGIFIKLNHRLEKVIQKEFVDSVNLVELYTSAFKVSDGYILGGYLQEPNYGLKGFVHKVDSVGNTLYKNVYGGSNEDNIFRRIFHNNDNTIIGVGGYKSIDSLLYVSWIGIINQQTGLLLKQWRPEQISPYNAIHFLKIVSPNEWLLLGKSAKTQPITQGILSQSYIAHIDTNFQILNFKGISEFDLDYSFLLGLDTTIDNNWCAAGYFNVTPTSGPSYRAGWISKFNMYGDTIWNRLDRAEINGEPAEVSFLGGLGVLPSGNIIAGGYASTGTQVVCWLIKVSNDGCIDTLDCAVVPAHEPPLLLEERVPATRVFPNPAREVVQVKLSPAASKNATVLLLYDMYGRQVLQRAVAAGERQFSVSLEGLEPGVYHWRLLANKGGLASESGTLVLVR